jgi:nucleotide-binding universal stress UspA family protein
MKLLIGYDASPAATTALHDLQNAGLPKTGEALLVGFADMFLPPFPPDAPFNAMEVNALEARREAETRRDTLLTETQNAALLLKESLPGWTVRAEADVDAPATGLLQRETDWKPDLLCIGAPHSSRLERLFFGSICARVVAHARCSVRIGRTEGHVRPLKLMLATDGSPDAEAAAEAILARRWPEGTEIRIVSVLDSRFAHFTGALLSPAAGDSDDGLLADLAGQFRAAGLKASFSVIDGNPKNELLKAAAEMGAHCIFAGASGAGTLERLIMGSVSSALAERAACSVEIVRRATTKTE